MTAHIPPHRLLPQDMVDIYDLGPSDEPHEKSVKVRMHASDARHAMGTEPKRWVLDVPVRKPVLIEPSDHDEGEEDDGD